MYLFHLINWNYECPFERLGNLIISIILCSTFTRVYIFCLFYFCIEFFAWDYGISFNFVCNIISMLPGVSN